MATKSFLIGVGITLATSTLVVVALLGAVGAIPGVPVWVPAYNAAAVAGATRALPSPTPTATPTEVPAPTPVPPTPTRAPAPPRATATPAPPRLTPTPAASRATATPGAAGGSRASVPPTSVDMRAPSIPRASL